MSDDRFKLTPAKPVPAPLAQKIVQTIAQTSPADESSHTTATDAPVLAPTVDAAANSSVDPVPPTTRAIPLERVFRLSAQIRAIDLWLVMGAFSLFIIWAGFAIGQHFGNRYGLMIGFFTAIALNILIFAYGEWLLKSLFIGREIEGRDPWGLLALNRELATRLKVPRAQICEVQSETPFLFSAGLFQGRIKIFYSTAMLKRFSQQELRALFGRELMRAASGQTRSATSIAALVNAWLNAMGILDAIISLRFLFRQRIRRWCPGPFTLISLPFVTIALRLVIRRRTALEIDRKTIAELDSTGALARVLAQALSKLDAYNRTLPIDVNFAEAALFAVFPLAKHSWSNWASVQPAIETRLQQLMGTQSF